MKHDFKTAAAKLLAQHPAQTLQDGSEGQSKKEEKPKATIVTMPVRETPPEAGSIPASAEERIAFPQLHQLADDDEASVRQAAEYQDPRRGMKNTIMVSLIVITTAVMVLAVPTTIIGIAGNILVGILAGGSLGWIINREL